MSSDPIRPKPPPTIPPPPSAKPPPAPIPAPPSAVKLPTIDPTTTTPYRPRLPPNKKRFPPPSPTRPRRHCTCCCFLIWLIIVLLILSVLLAASLGIFWLLYNPQRPKFTLASLKLQTLNLTGNLDSDASARLLSAGNLTLSQKNPNRKISTTFGPFTLSVFSPGNVQIANASFTGFESGPGNYTVMRAVFKEVSVLDLDAARVLRSDLGKGEMRGVRVEMETKMGVKIGRKRTGKVGIKVTCRGVRAALPKNEVEKKKREAAEAPGPAASVAVKRRSVKEEAAIGDQGKCVVDLSVKILGFTFGLF